MGLDVYEKESAYFFADGSSKIIYDDNFARLLSFYNVFMTYSTLSFFSFFQEQGLMITHSGHQAFLTVEALKNIAETTIDNLELLANNEPCPNITEA